MVCTPVCLLGPRRGLDQERRLYPVADGSTGKQDRTRFGACVHAPGVSESESESVVCKVIRRWTSEGIGGVELWHLDMTTYMIVFIGIPIYGTMRIEVD